MGSQKLTTRVEAEIQRLTSEYRYNESVLREFAQFVLTKEPAKSKAENKRKAKRLSVIEIKQKIYQHFGVDDTKELKKSGAFQLASSGMGKVNLSTKEDWEQLYRKLIGVLPGEENEDGYGCINGINIFKYDMPWKAFGLDPKIHQLEDIKVSYRSLSKLYHPDNSRTGDAAIFDRLTVFYKSLTERF